MKASGSCVAAHALLLQHYAGELVDESECFPNSCYWVKHLIDPVCFKGEIR